MANLETLELTINGSAKSASEGIDQLITSLSSLSDALAKPYSDLRDFNAELQKTARLGKSINFSGLNKATASVKSVVKTKKATGTYDVAHNNGRGYTVPPQSAESIAKDEEFYSKFRANATADYEKKKAYHDWATQRRAERKEEEEYRKLVAEKIPQAERQGLQDAIAAEKQAMDVRGDDTKVIMEQSDKIDLLRLKQDALKMETISLSREGKLTTKQIAERSIQYQKLGEEINKLTNQSSKLKEEMPKAIASVKKSASGLLSTIGRIFKTMMIRTAIRALLKAAKEGLDNYYQYAKKMNLAFGNNMDAVYKKWTQLKNQMGAALGSALNAVLPILNALASAAITAFNTITALFALISGSSTYSRAKDGMDDYAEAVGGASNAAKDWLATFDELNVMTKESGGGGGGSSNYGSMFEEVQLPDWMIEWKPIIEAVLGGTLGAIILPKVFDWISKIFGLFGGSDAVNALDILKKMNDLDDTDFTKPSDGIDNFLKPFSSPDVLDGVGDIADLLSTVKNMDWKKILVENIPELVGLAIDLIRKLIQGLDTTSKINVDRSDFDQFKSDFDNFKKEYEKFGQDEKTISIRIDDDTAKITRLTNWVATPETKEVNVEVTLDAADISKLTNWVATDETKTVNVDAVLDAKDISKVTQWIGTEETKTVNVDVVPDAKDISKISLWIGTEETKTVNVDVVLDAKDISKLSLWVGTNETKTVNVDVVLDVADISKVTLWVGTEETKTIKVSFDAMALATYAFVVSNINTWVNADATKTIKVEFDVIKYAAYGLIVVAINTWVAAEATKRIGLEIATYAAFAILTTAIDQWVNAVPTKDIKIEFEPTSYASFKVLVDTIDTWVNAIPTKSINVSINPISSGGSSTPIVNVGDDGFVKWGDPDAWWNKPYLGLFESAPQIDVDVDVVSGGQANLQKELDGFDLDADVDVNADQTQVQKEAKKTQKTFNDYFEESKKVSITSDTKSTQNVAKTQSKAFDESLVLKHIVQVAASVKDTKENATTNKTAFDSVIQKNKSIVTVAASVKDTKANATTNKTAFDSVLSAKKSIITVGTNDDNLKGVRSDIVDSVSGVKANVNAELSNKTSFIQSVRNAIQNAIQLKIVSTVNAVMTVIGKITTQGFATGGFPSEGQLFVAREAGPEMVGNIGSHTAVANNDQIVEGIANGVYAANEEQNALLRRQNELLAALLQKDTSVKIGASALLGRTVQQSLDMYSAVTG